MTIRPSFVRTPRSVRGRRAGRARRADGQLLDLLEPRQLLSALMHPTYKVFQPMGSLSPMAASATPSGVIPATMRHAYGIDKVLFGSITGDGTGQTIAIVDAYDLPTVITDLASFDAALGLPDPPSFQVVNQTGGSTRPPADTKGGWGVEIALDVEWAHALAPKANILLVEANSAYDTDLYPAVDWARNYPGVTAVSMSWGGDETSADAANDFHFTTPAGHIGVTFFSSSGDNGAYSSNGGATKIVGYPAVSPNVVAVGGTTLTTDASANWASEAGWGNGTNSKTFGGSGGGISKYFAKPSYQSGVTLSATFRTVPDIAMDADPASGVPVYSAYDNGATTPWLTVGGTSLSSPMWAGLLAVANQGRALAGLSSLDGATETLPLLYSLPASDFHDITTGNNGYAASVGYDLVTGLGSPIANLLVADLASPGAPHIASFVPNPATVTIGSSTTLTASGVSEAGGSIAAVNFYFESNGVPGLQVGSDTTLGVGSQSGTTWALSATTSNFTAGSYTYYAVATDALNVSSSVYTALLTVTNPAASSGPVLTWNVNGQTGFGTQNLAATAVASGVTNSTGLTRGSAVVTTGTAASNAWGGANWASTSSAGIVGNQFVTFGLTVNSGQILSLASLDLNYRRSSSGPSSGYWQYQINSGAWTLLGNFTNQFASTSSSGAAMTQMNLSTVAGLQNLRGGTVLNFRVTPYGSTSSGGTWYVYHKSTADLLLSGTIDVANAAPSVATPASPASPTLAGTSTTLTVLGADDQGEANLTYTWSVTSLPLGVTAPAFSINGTNASKNTLATFSHAGSYAFQVTITDAAGATASSATSVTVLAPIGDANGDLNVDLSDYDIWFANVGSAAPSGPSTGDFNNDNQVDLADYDVWFAHVGTTAYAAIPSVPSVLAAPLSSRPVVAAPSGPLSPAPTSFAQAWMPLPFGPALTDPVALSALPFAHPSARPVPSRWISGNDPVAVEWPGTSGRRPLDILLPPIA